MTNKALVAATLVLIAAVPSEREIGRAQTPDSRLARIAALEDELDALEREIQALEDTKAIKRLQRAYGYYVDKSLSSEGLSFSKKSKE